MEDLIIENDINNNSNNRIFIFHNEENEIKNKVEILGMPKEIVEECAEKRIDILHESYLSEYLNKRYLDCEQIQHYKNSNVLVILYTLNDEKNDLIICDKTFGNNKTALIVIPYTVDKIQIDNLKKYKEYFKDYAWIYEGGLHLEKVSPTCDEYIIAPDEEDYFQKNSFDKIITNIEKYVKEDSKKK